MEDLSKLHKNIDRFYSTGYLACWCSIVRSDWSRFLAEIFNNERFVDLLFDLIFKRPKKLEKRKYDFDILF